MTRAAAPLVVACVLAFGAFGAFGAFVAAQDQATFRSGVELVSLDVSVRSRLGAVTGLGPDDFALLDNGVRQHVEVVAEDKVPVDVTFVLDASGSTATELDRFKSDIRKVAELLRPTDRLRLIGFAADVQELVPWQAADAEMPKVPIASFGSTSLNDALVYAFVGPSPAERRRLVVAFTDGYENSSLIDDGVVGAIIGRADAVLHVVLPTADVSATAGVTAEGRSRASLIKAAVSAGGGAHYLDEVYHEEAQLATMRDELAQQAVLQTLHDVLNDFRQSYVLRYSVDGVARGGWHTISVKVGTEDRYTIRAKAGYFGG